MAVSMLPWAVSMIASSSGWRSLSLTSRSVPVVSGRCRSSRARSKRDCSALVNDRANEIQTQPSAFRAPGGRRAAHERLEDAGADALRNPRPIVRHAEEAEFSIHPAVDLHPSGLLVEIAHGVGDQVGEHF